MYSVLNVLTKGRSALVLSVLFLIASEHVLIAQVRIIVKTLKK